MASEKTSRRPVSGYGDPSGKHSIDFVTWNAELGPTQTQENSSGQVTVRGPSFKTTLAYRENQNY